MYQSPTETFPDSQSAGAHAWLKRSLIALAALAVLAVLITVLFVLWPTPTPTDVAEQYIENHYDAIAEDIAHLIMPDSPLKAEIAAEILESLAERAIPYSCLPAARQSESAVPRQLYLPVGVNQFCRFTSSAWPRCWAASVR